MSSSQLNPRGGGRRTKPCDHTTREGSAHRYFAPATVVAFVVVVVAVIAVCRCGCGSVVTAVVGLLCVCSCCGGPYGYLSRPLVSLPPPVELLDSTWIVIVRWVVGVIIVVVAVEVVTVVGLRLRLCVCCDLWLWP